MKEASAKKNKNNALDKNSVKFEEVAAFPGTRDEGGHSNAYGLPHSNYLP